MNTLYKLSRQSTIKLSNMKTIISSIVIVIFVTNFTQAQTLAITEGGDTVYIYDNGTWSYEIDENYVEANNINTLLSVPIEIDSLNGVFVLDAKCNKLVSSKLNQFDFNYDASKWKRIPPASLNPDAEFAFQNKETDIWCAIITEVTEIGKENILKIAKYTMEQNTGASVTIRAVENRFVNGSDVLRGSFNAMINGIDFIFDTYYYSDERGTTQVTTWTSHSIYNTNDTEIHNFLNGFVVK